VVIKQIFDHLMDKAETNEPGRSPETRAPPLGPQAGLFD
jgi:hypothetical protein